MGIKETLAMLFRRGDSKKESGKQKTIQEKLVDAYNIVYQHVASSEKDAINWMQEMKESPKKQREFEEACEFVKAERFSKLNEQVERYLSKFLSEHPETRVTFSVSDDDAIEMACSDTHKFIYYSFDLEGNMVSDAEGFFASNQPLPKEFEN